MVDSYNLEDVFDEIVPCIERRVSGQSATTQQRRRALVDYFIHCACWAGDAGPGAAAAVQYLAAFADLIDEACEAIQDRATPLDDDDVNSIANILKTVRDNIEHCFRELDAPLQHNDQAAVAALIQRCLQSFFDWDSSGNLRGYVYARTSEILVTNHLHQERHLLVAAIRECVKETE